MILKSQTTPISITNIPSLIILLILTLIITSTDCRLYAKEFKSANLRTQKGWIYLDRMRFSPGQATIQYEVSLQGSSQPAPNRYKLTLQLIPQNAWDIHRNSKCQANNQHTQVLTPLKQTISLYLNSQGSLRNKTTLTIPIGQAITYYLVVTDCQKSLINEYFNKKSKFNIRVTMKNNGKNYGDDQSTYNWLIPTLIAIQLYCIYLINRKTTIYSQYKDNQDIDWPKVIVKIVIWAYIVALGFLLLGQFIYVIGQGNNYQAFTFVYLLSGTFGQTLLLILLTFLAYGWITTFQFAQNDNQQIYYPIASVMGFISIVLSLLSKINDDDIDKTHIYDSLAIDIQIILKAVGLCTFFVGIIKYRYGHNKNKGLMRYLLGLGLYGVFCYCATPIVILYQDNIYRHSRQTTVLTTTQIIKCIQVVFLTYQLIGRTSTYNRNSLQNRSFMEQQNKYL